MRALQILVPVIAMTLTVPAAAKEKLVRAPDDRKFAQIADCLKKVGLEEGEDFRQKPGSAEARGKVQIRPDLFDDPIWRKARPEIDGCFTK